MQSIVLYIYDDQIYRASFRIKAVKGSVPSAPIALLEVVDGTTVVSSRTLYNNTTDFPSNNVYYRFTSPDFDAGSTAPVNPPNSVQIQAMPSMPLGQAKPVFARTFDLRVRWYNTGNSQLWFDNVRIDGARYYLDRFPEPDQWVSRGPAYAENLFGGGLDPEISDRATLFNSEAALHRFYLRDEPWINQYYSARYLESRLAAEGGSITTGKGMGHAAIQEVTFQGIPPFGRYSFETHPFELSPDIYRFHYDDPLPGAGNYTSFTQLGDGSEFSGLQTAISKYKTVQQNIVNAQSHQWWQYLNIGLWGNPGEHWSREPYLSEIYAQVYLALSYGAKGIVYFNFWSDGYNPSTNTGVVGLINEDMTPITNSRYGENKWAGIRTLNQKLAGPFGSTLMKLTWLNGFSIHQNNNITGDNAFPKITKVITTADMVAQRYVELGLFENLANGVDYFMLVNRRTASSESRTLRTYFNANGSTWEIVDVSTNTCRIISPSGYWFEDAFQPGEGKLYYKYPYAAPPRPTNLSYTVNPQTHPVISWTASPDIDVVRYDVYRDLGSGYSLIGSTTTTSYTDADLSVTSYNPYVAWYYVQAVDVVPLVSQPSAALRVWYYALVKNGGAVMDLPNEFSLKENYPNPFNPSTTLSYDIPEDTYVDIRVYSSLGQEVAVLVSGFKSPGRYNVEWNATRLPSGVYLCKMQAGKFRAVQKMLLMK